MARVLCVNPWIYDFAAYNLWIEPLGLLSVAAVLRAAGHEVALIDCLDRRHPRAPPPRSARDAYGCGRFQKVELPKPDPLARVPRRWGRYGLPVEVFEAELDAQPRPDAVLVTSMMTYWYPGAFEVIRRLQARWPGAPIALGVQVRTAQYSPIPGTREWEAAVAEGCIAVDADPLLHNNSLFSCTDGPAWEALKVEVREGNLALLDG